MEEERVLLAGVRAWAAARAATLRSTLSGVPSPEPVLASCERLPRFCERRPFLLPLLPRLSLSFPRPLRLDLSEPRSGSLPEEAARERASLGPVLWELRLCVHWLLLSSLLLRLLPPSPSLLPLLQALWPLEERVSASPSSFPYFLRSLSSRLPPRLLSVLRGGTRAPGRWRVERDEEWQDCVWLGVCLLPLGLLVLLLLKELG